MFFCRYCNISSPSRNRSFCFELQRRTPADHDATDHSSSVPLRVIDQQRLLQWSEQYFQVWFRDAVGRLSLQWTLPVWSRASDRREQSILADRIRRSTVIVHVRLTVLCSKHRSCPLGSRLVEQIISVVQEMLFVLHKKLLKNRKLLQDELDAVFNKLWFNKSLWIYCALFLLCLILITRNKQ